ncbi:arsenate reductase ArsC [Hyalangium versicolor]|uniref:arsenate reductase ArsC n=1 Tax=Hyalangium versicolor TaxID=2861190 RepID=UPI001CCE3541|nr:arsenate reductase ArsC [Hyalangium versicolor]
MTPHQPLRILFLSTGNAARTILAEYILRSVGHSHFEPYSAGMLPREKVHPLTLKVLRERFHLDPAGARSKSWEEFRDLPLDLIITICDKAREALPLWPGQPVVAHWDEPNPVDFEGDEAEHERFFWKVGRELAFRLDLLCALPTHKLLLLRPQPELQAAAS